ncbi:MAG: type II toxin-antitoxin system VapC family toxin [Asticcacaulis sp.]|nr:type II toxin-antitoxin system VapC family toxin [Asticcacaulis sp.]
MPGTLTEAIASADAIYVSPVSLFEIGQKVRLGKWPEMAPLASRLPDILMQQGGLVATLTPEICMTAALLDWDHRDPFDRFLAATSLVNKWPLASVDTAFDTLVHDGKRVARVS